MSSAYLLQAVGIKKSYPQGNDQLEILKGLDLEILPGEAICILGASGCGKSTLLQILGTLDRPTEGDLFLEDKNLLELTDEELSLYRSEKMGFVFQSHHLIMELTALENVMLPCRVAGMHLREARGRAMDLLDKIGLSHRIDHFPNQLSGGELQRVAIARALVRNPQILFADEPTGNLDSANSQIIQNLFFELKESFGVSLIVVTHDLQFAARFPKIYRMKDGRWVS